MHNFTECVVFAKTQHHTCNGLELLGLDQSLRQFSQHISKQSSQPFPVVMETGGVVVEGGLGVTGVGEGGERAGVVEATSTDRGQSIVFTLHRLLKNSCEI